MRFTLCKSLLVLTFFAPIWAVDEDSPVVSTAALPGGPHRAPGTQFKFIEEQKGGTTPKFAVKDENGVVWRVKAGPEARPETAATRLLRAAGYTADEDYYRAEIRVQGLKTLSRGNEYLGAGGIVRDVRLERSTDQKPGKGWDWHKARPTDRRTFNGLRIMMALINNWDLKTSNNSYGRDENDMVVSDLGATFGKTGNVWVRSKGDVEDYAESKFVKKVTPEHVDFVMNSRPFFLVSVIRPVYYIERTRMERVAQGIPIADARALGERLGRLPRRQIAQCFRDAGYSPQETEGFTKAVLERIQALKNL